MFCRAGELLTLSSDVNWYLSGNSLLLRLGIKLDIGSSACELCCSSSSLHAVHCRTKRPLLVPLGDCPLGVGWRPPKDTGDPGDFPKELIVEDMDNEAGFGGNGGFSW